MSAFATIGIHNNFTACKPGIAMRSTDYKLTCWVNEIFNIVAKKFAYPYRQSPFNPWQKDVFYIVSNLILHCFFSSFNCFWR